jgi:hypothetical protein
MVKREGKKVPWVPDFLRNNEEARVGLGVWLKPGQQPDKLDWLNLWMERLINLAKEWTEGWPESGAMMEELEVVRIWESEGERILFLNPTEMGIMTLIDCVAPGLREKLAGAQRGNQEDRAKLLEKFPQFDPAPSLEQQRKELEESSLDDVVTIISGPSPFVRARVIRGHLT